MWDLLKANFGGDETYNFGPRNETGSALFQVETMATLSCQDQTNTKVPAMDSAVLGDYACFAVDKTLVLNSTNLLSFESEIDEMEWVQDGRFVLIMEKGGSIYIMNGETGQIVFSFPLIPEGSQENHGKTFMKILLSGNGSVIILTANGVLMVLQDLDIFKQGCDMKELMKEKLHTVDTTDYQSKINDAVVHGEYIYTLGGTESIICKWKMQRNGVEIEDCVETQLENHAVLLQGYGSTDGKFLFVLDSLGHVTVWDTSTLNCVKHFTDMKISNFCLLETEHYHNNSCSLEGMRLVVITRTDSDQCDLIVYSLPQWENVYKLELTGPSRLAKCNTKQDDIYVTELCGEGKDGSYATVRFRCLKETDPKTRLHKLLKKNKFEEAMLFAKLYRLELELVHEVKCNYLLDELSVCNIEKYDEETIKDMATQFWECLDKIEDNIMAARSCMIASLSTFTETKNLQMYCKTRLSKMNANDRTAKDKHDALQSELLQQQHRLMTFEMAFGESAYSAEKWERFKHADLLKESLSLMENGNLDAGFIIWMQHQTEWREREITAELIWGILSNIPTETPIAKLCGYLTTAILPVIVREIPITLNILIEYVIDKAKRIEKKDKKCWPGAAIEFCDYMIQHIGDFVSVSMEDVCMAKETAEKTNNRCETMLEPLNILRVRLQQLDDVIHKYECPLTLTEFLEETRETITFRMLDKVHAIELIVPTLERQIRPYIKEHGLNQDNIFSRYIKDLLERQGQQRNYTGEVVWESKSVAIIDCISDPEQKIEGIMEVMKWAPIPWSDEIDKLVQMGLKIKHIEVKRLREQCDRVRLRKLLIKYGMRNIEVPQGQDVEHLACVMLKQDQTGCMEDALEVFRSSCATNEHLLYVFRVRELILAEKLEECLNLIRGLPVKIGLEVGKRILDSTKDMLDSRVEIAGLENKTRADMRLFTEAAVHINKYLQTIEQGVIELEDLKYQEQVLHNIFFIQKEFDLYPSSVEYRDEQNRFEILMDFVTDSKQTQNSSYVKICRLAKLLQIPRSELQAKMAIQLAHSGNIKTVVEICRKILYESSPTEETAEIMYEVASSLLALQSEVDIDDMDADPLRVLSELCSRLADRALSLCSQDSMLKFLGLARGCSYLLSVSQQCEFEEDPLSAQWGEDTLALTENDREEFGDLSLSVFQEDALPMNSGVALSLVSKYVVQYPFTEFKPKEEDEDEDEEEENEKSFYISQCSKVEPVIQYLRDNSQIQLALSFTIDGLYNLLQHAWQENMGLPLSKEKEAVIAEEKKTFLQVFMKSQTVLKELVHNTVIKIFSASKVDSSLAFAYLTLLPKREVMEIMKKLVKGAGNQYKKLKKVAGLGIALGEMFREVSLISSLKQLEINAHWGYRLSKINVCFKDALHSSLSKKESLLPLIAKSPLADTQLVKEFCQDFDLDQDKGLLMYLRHLFTPEKDLSVGGKTHDKQNLMTRMKKAIPEIENKDDLMLEMKTIYYRTSGYDYETLDVLLEVLKLGNCEDIPVEKGIKLLEYLKVYKRQSIPTLYEKEYKSIDDPKESTAFMESLPDESKYRLPYHILLHGKAWNIITPELTKDSIQSWLLISKLLDLSSDQICMTSVQNLVQSYSQSFSQTDGGSDMSLWHWDMGQANLRLLQEAKDIMTNIKSSESFLAVGKWMVKHLPQGSEKVIVLKELINYAELWHHSIPEEQDRKKENAKAAYLKFLSHFERMSSTQILCNHGLGEPELIQMTKNPAQLIQKLYEHPSISDLEWQKTATKPDIHGAAESLCQINSIEFTITQKTMLKTLLHSNSSRQQDIDETMTFNLDNLKLSETFMETENDEEINFKRLVYLMQKGCMKDNLLLLCHFAYDDNEDSVSRIRALRCLLNMADDETLKCVCDKPRKDIKHLLYVMIYVAGLEKLHVNHSVSTFINCQKESLVKGLWKNHSHEKTAACVVSSLCLDYQIHDHQLWASVLQRLYSFGLMKQLEYVLLRLNSIPKLWHLPAFSKMWYMIISSPLSTVCPPLTQEQTNTCVFYFNLLMTCPVRQELDCVSLSHQFQKLELYGCAVGCLIFCKSETNQLSLEFIQSHGKGILTSLPELMRSGLPYGISQRIKEHVFEYVLSSDSFMLVMGNSYQADFIKHCVKERNIDQLLVFGIQNKRLDECKNLISLYLNTYPEIQDQVTDYVDGVEKCNDLVELLKAYMHMQNLPHYQSL